MTGRTPRVLTSTYRLQFSKRFTFRDAERIIPYLARLGVSHIYASPYLKSRAGSAHGYDITDYNALNPEIGDETDLNALVAMLTHHNMGQILDFVPNHMGIGKSDNEWWLDLLEWGLASPYAEYFDIDWAPAKADLQAKVLLPFLGDHYGNVLEKGELQVALDESRGGFVVRYHDHTFPIRPAHYAQILAPCLARLRAAGDRREEALASLADIEARAPDFRIRRLAAEERRVVRERGIAFKREFTGLVASYPDVRAIVDEAMAEMNGSPGQRASFRPLHRLLERQSYRLAFWRVATHEINYRRFFDINDLAGVRMERPRLFETAHRLVWRLVDEDKLDGLRIDHIDGMLDPTEYCRRLAARAPADPGAATSETRFYVVVEKILARHESLRSDWPIDGTTGYDVLNLINGLFVRPDAEEPLTRVYHRFIDRPFDFDAELYRCKKLIMDQVLASELEVLANELDKLSESHWATRDFTLIALRDALQEVAACFPVYRTYVDEAGITAEDRRDIDWAVSQARKRSENREDTIFDFIHGMLTTDAVRRRRSGYGRRSTIRFAMKFQQYTGPVMAKSLEDTSFYRWNRLLSLNEVGGDPRRFGVTPAAFHHQVLDRARRWPHAMTTTATHDTKRGEDARARLDVLSEMAGEWGSRVDRWATFNRRFKTQQDEAVFPTANDEYLFYQLMLGSWPNELGDAAALDVGRLESLRERIEGAAIKSLREAKLQTSWARPDQAYEDAALAFLRGILDPARSPQFLTDFIDFAKRIAWFGMLNSLSQTILRLTLPGVPDTYQGADLWDYAMVDPDNRRPVDFAQREALLQRVEADFGADALSSDGVAQLIGNWTDGRIKLLILTRLLHLRRRLPALFLCGNYQPLTVDGPRGEHLCAFACTADGATLVVAAPRFFVGLGDNAGNMPAADVWSDTAVILPAELLDGRLTNVLTGEVVTPVTRETWPALAMDQALARLPWGVWLAERRAA